MRVVRDMQRAADRPTPRDWRGLIWAFSLVMAVVLSAIPATADFEVDPDDSIDLAAADPDPDDPAVLVLPVSGEHPLVDNWSNPPGESTRRHLGMDIPAVRMTPLLAVRQGTVTAIRHSNLGAEGNMVILTDSRGWKYLYIHLNNDSPGTTDDSNEMQYAFGPGITVGAEVQAGDVIGYAGDSGNATGPHLHFAMVDPSGQYVNPFPALVRAAAGPGAVAVMGASETALANTGSRADQLGWIAINLVVFGLAMELGALVLLEMRRGYRTIVAGINEG